MVSWFPTFAFTRNHRRYVGVRKINPRQYAAEIPNVPGMEVGGCTSRESSRPIA